MVSEWGFDAWGIILELVMLHSFNYQIYLHPPVSCNTHLPFSLSQPFLFHISRPSPSYNPIPPPPLPYYIYKFMHYVRISTDSLFPYACNFPDSSNFVFPFIHSYIFLVLKFVIIFSADKTITCLTM